MENPEKLATQGTHMRKIKIIKKKTHKKTHNIMC